jgi:tetratricopeptide (TPR) repeat protein
MDQGRIQLLLREAVTSAKAGNTIWARECLSRVLRADPRNEIAWFWLSAVLETIDEKRYCLERVLSLNPDNQQARSGLQWLEQQAQADSGIPKPKRTICPMCGEPNIPSAFRCANCNQDLYVNCPNCGQRVDIDLVECNTCGLAIGDSADGAAYFFRLGQLYFQHGQPKVALEAWEKTLLLEPEYPRVAELAAEAFHASGQRGLAIQSIQRAIEEADGENDRRRLRLRLASYYRDQNQMEEASNLYQELLQEDQQRGDLQADLYAEVGRFHAASGDADAARQSYEMAVTLDETLHETRLALAEIYLADGNEVRGLRELRKLESADGEIARQAAVRLAELRPPIPESFKNRWQETVRGMARYGVAGLLLLMLTVGRNWGDISTWNIGGLVCFLIGGYFLTAATIAPKNLPTLAPLARLAEKPMAVRLRSRTKKRTGPPEWVQDFDTWQKKAAQALATRLRLLQARIRQGLGRVGTATSRRWHKVKQSKPLHSFAALPRSRAFRALSALLKKPFFRGIREFFRAIGRFFRTIGRFFLGLFQRIWPRRAARSEGPSVFRRTTDSMRDGWAQLRGRFGRTEISELQIYRWMSGVLGVLLVILAGGLVIFF